MLAVIIAVTTSTYKTTNPFFGWHILPTRVRPTMLRNLASVTGYPFADFVLLFTSFKLITAYLPCRIILPVARRTLTGRTRSRPINSDRRISGTENAKLAATLALDVLVPVMSYRPFGTEDSEARFHNLPYYPWFLSIFPFLYARIIINVFFFISMLHVLNF